MSLALLWVVLTGGDTETWPIGAAGVAIAAGLSLLLLPPAPGPGGWRPAGLVRFVPGFLGRSLLGGIDVARRAFDPRLPIAPAVIDYELRLSEGPARVVFADVVSLLPGTLAVGIAGAGDRLRIHVLDQGPAVLGQLAAEEDRVARLFRAEERRDG